MTLKTTVIGLLISFAICLPIHGLAADTASPDELLFWESIKDSSNHADFEAYLTQYPNGSFVALAKNRLAPNSAESESTIAAQSATTEDLPSILIDSNLGNGEKIELTVLSEDYVKRVIEVANDKFNPAFEYFTSKAQYFNYLLSRKNKKSGKYFIEGSIYLNSAAKSIGLKYFSMPVIAIKKNGVNTPYVVDFYHDPDKALYTVEEWKNEVINSNKSSDISDYFTNQYHFSPKTKSQYLIAMTPEARASFEEIAKDGGILITKY